MKGLEDRILAMSDGCDSMHDSDAEIIAGSFAERPFRLAEIGKNFIFDH
jgi:hypothetical protein